LAGRVSRLGVWLELIVTGMGNRRCSIYSIKDGGERRGHEESVS